MTMKTCSFHALSALLLLTAPCSLLADAIPARPIGFLAKGALSSDPSDFYAIQGPNGKTNTLKVVFTAKTKDLGEKGTQRAFYAHFIEPKDDPTERFVLIDKRTAPLKKLATFKLPPGEKFRDFIKTDNIGFNFKDRSEPDRLLFRVPGSGYYSSSGGNKPAKLRAESAKDPTTAVRGPGVRLSEYIFNHDDVELQARLFFSASDAKRGREPYISGGTSRTTKLLADIYTERGVGSDAEQFVAFGPQNETQKAFFVAKSPADNNTFQLWQVTVQNLNGRIVYGAAPFTSGAFALAGKPENLIANGFDLFFTAPLVAGGTPVLWYLPGNTVVSPADLVTYPNALDPQNLTFTRKDDSYSELVMTVAGTGARRYARWIETTVVVLDGTGPGAPVGMLNPTLITDAGQYFYFAADDGDFAGTENFLVQHAFAGSDLTYIDIGDNNFPFNIKEMCVASSDGTAGTLYFVADAFVDGGNTPKQDVLFQMPANDGSTRATPVRTATNKLVLGAHNLHDVVNNSGVGVFRVYFAAPINSTQNSEFLPPNSTDEGVEPWVYEAP